MRSTLPAKAGVFFQKLHRQLFAIHDSPRRVAAGFGIGVFAGILPGMGPVASLVLASFLRVNKASALIGSLLTNTWISFVAFFMAVKIGGGVFSLPWEEVESAWNGLIENFQWKALFEAATAKIILPVLAGYVGLGLIAAAVGYLLVYGMLTLKRG